MRAYLTHHLDCILLISHDRASKQANEALHYMQRYLPAVGLRGRRDHSAAWQQYGCSCDPAGRVLEGSTIDGHINQEADCINWHMQSIHTTAVWLAAGQTEQWAALRSPQLYEQAWGKGTHNTVWATVDGLMDSYTQTDYNSIIMHGLWCYRRWI